MSNICVTSHCCRAAGSGSPASKHERGAQGLVPASPLRGLGSTSCVRASTGGTAARLIGGASAGGSGRGGTERGDTRGCCSRAHGTERQGARDQGRGSETRDAELCVDSVATALCVSLQQLTHRCLCSDQWDVQATIQRVNESLIARGYITWFDLTNMKGNEIPSGCALRPFHCVTSFCLRNV